MFLTDWFRRIFPRPFPVLKCTFLGWRDEELAERFQHSVGFYDEEIRAKREQPFHPNGLLFVDGPEDKNGTIIGKQLEAIYDSSLLSSDEVIGYINRIGLRVEKC